MKVDEDRQAVVGPAGSTFKRGLVLTIIVYDLLRHLGRMVVRDLPLAVPKLVDEGVLRLDLSSLMQQVLEEILKGVLDEVLDEVHLKEVLERVLVATLREGLEEVPEEVDLLLLLPLSENREEEEEELEKEGGVKDRKKIRTHLF
jgi:hypothetical protein